MNIFAEIKKIDPEQRMVWGYASTEALDCQEEKVSKKAVESALEDYMKWANIREMHKASAVGVAKEANLDEKGLFIAAKVVDDAAWEKVKEGVYKGFSIGGKKLTKVNDTITALSLTEISLVDRPANPECRVDIWKAVDVEKVAAREDVNPERGKTEYGDVKFADEKNKKYPIDTEAHIRAAWNYINKPKNSGKYSAEDVKSIKGKIVAAWKAKIDKEGPPSAKGEKAMEVEDIKKYAGEEIGDAATAISALSTIAYLYQKEASEPEGDQAASLKAVIDNLKNFIASEIMESDPEDVINLSSKPGDLLKVSYNGEDGKKIEMEFMDGTLAKAGARHSKADSERIQGIHDHAAGLGADCSSVKVASADDLQKVHDETIAKMAVVEADLTKLQGENDDLKKAMEAKEARIKELEKEPAEPKGIQKAVVVEKSQDSQVLSGDIPEDIRKLAEKVEKQEARPDDVLKVILKHGGRAQ